MKQINVLFGFDAPQFSDEVLALLRKRGYVVESVVKLTKSSIRDFLLANPSYGTAVLLEVMNNSADSSSAKYTADELAMLTDERNINIVVILNYNHKGTKYMETLYTAGITSAIYQKGRQGGASPKDVVERIINGRNNRQAREYYGIADAPINLGFLGNDTFIEYYNRLQDNTYGVSLIERFVNVCRMMNRKQIADFIRRTPAEVVDELKNYEEFHVILDIIKGSGIDLKIKRPKKLKIGLSTPGSIEQVRVSIRQNEGISQVDDDKEQISVSGEDINRVAEEPSVGEKRVTETFCGQEKTARQAFADMLNTLWVDECEESVEEKGADGSFFYDMESAELDEVVELQKNKDDSYSENDVLASDFIREEKGKLAKTRAYVVLVTGVFSAILILVGVVMILV